MSSSFVRLILTGSEGRMGRMVQECLKDHPSIQLVSTVSSKTSSPNLESILGEVEADVLLDFTHPESVYKNVEVAFRYGVSPVIGTSGIHSDLEKMGEWSQFYKIPGIWVPNFSLTAVLMMHFAELAARWIPDVEIIEYHHLQKADAPSGTAIRTAQKIAKARIQAVEKNKNVLVESYLGALGAEVEKVPVHSIRLNGFMAHQEVIFGSLGESLTLRCDNYDRKSYYKGIETAILRIREQSGFLIGLETLLF